MFFLLFVLSRDPRSVLIELIKHTFFSVTQLNTNSPLHSVFATQKINKTSRRLSRGIKAGHEKCLLKFEHVGHHIEMRLIRDRVLHKSLLDGNWSDSIISAAQFSRNSCHSMIRQLRKKKSAFRQNQIR